MNKGKFYELGTDSDAGFYLELKIIDSLEPVLTAKEIKPVHDHAESTIIHIPTGLICIDPHLSADEALHFLSLSVIPGNY